MLGEGTNGPGRRARSSQHASRTICGSWCRCASQACPMIILYTRFTWDGATSCDGMPDHASTRLGLTTSRSGVRVPQRPLVTKNTTLPLVNGHFSCPVGSGRFVALFKPLRVRVNKARARRLRSQAEVSPRAPRLSCRLHRKLLGHPRTRHFPGGVELVRWEPLLREITISLADIRSHLIHVKASSGTENGVGGSPGSGLSHQIVSSTR